MTAAKTRISNSIHCIVVSNSDQLQDAFAVRSIVYMEGNGLARRKAFDGNDFVSTHFVIYDGDEPIGASRVRWFANFAKIERTAFREEFRNIRNIKTLAEFIFSHAAKKGYTTVVTHAEEKYARIWTKLLGFRLTENRPILEAPGFEPHLEMVKQLEPVADPVVLGSHPSVLFRIEGAWDVSSSFG